VSVNLLASASLVSPPLSLDHEIDCPIESPEIDSLFPDSIHNSGDFLLFDTTNTSSNDVAFNFDSLVDFDNENEQFRTDQFDNAISV
jgi:hypothetical protein